MLHKLLQIFNLYCTKSSSRIFKDPDTQQTKIWSVLKEGRKRSAHEFKTTQVLNFKTFFLHERFNIVWASNSRKWKVIFSNFNIYTSPNQRAKGFCWKQLHGRGVVPFHRKWAFIHNLTLFVVPWCSGYHYCTTSFNKAWTQVLRRFKSCLWCVGDLRWWGSLKIRLNAFRWSTIPQKQFIIIIIIINFNCLNTWKN